MSYDDIIELITVNSEKRFHGDIQTRLVDIERSKLKEKFIETFINMSNIGMAPYDILLHFTRTNEDII